MTYTLFYTDLKVSKAQYRKAKASNLSPYRYEELDDALGMARHIEARGGVAWEIEVSDGTPIGQPEIARLLRERAAQLVGRPKVQ